MNIADRTLPINGYCMVHTRQEISGNFVFCQGWGNEDGEFIFWHYTSALSWYFAITIIIPMIYFQKCIFVNSLHPLSCYTIELNENATYIFSTQQPPQILFVRFCVWSLRKRAGCFASIVFMMFCDC